MAVEIRCRRRARDDLLQTFEIIGANDPLAADRFLDAMEARSKQLADLILYETEPNSDTGPIGCVEIVRVIDGRRDLTTLD